MLVQSCHSRRSLPPSIARCVAPLASLAGSICPTVSIHSGITATLVLLGADAAGPKRVEVARDADTMRGPAMVAGRAGLLSVTTASVAAPLAWGFSRDIPHGDGNRSLALAGTLRAVVGMDDGRRLGGHGAVVGQSPDMKRPTPNARPWYAPL